MRLGCHRCPGLAIVVAALTLVAAPPAGALAAGEESGGASTSDEAATEPSGGTTEPAPSSPGSTGWTPVGAGTGASSDGASPTRRGSSLGSGGRSEQTGSTGEGKSESTSEEPSYATGSGGGYASESSTSSTFEEAASTPQAKRTTGSAASPPTIDKAVSVGVGAATPVALPESPQGGSVNSASLAAAPFTDSRDQATSDSDGLPLLAAIVLGFILAYAGGRLGLRLWRRRAQRRQLGVRLSREADWKAVLRQIELTRAPGTSDPTGKKLRRIETGSDSAPLKMRTGGMAGQDRARRKPAKAR